MQEKYFYRILTSCLKLHLLFVMSGFVSRFLELRQQHGTEENVWISVEVTPARSFTICTFRQILWGWSRMDGACTMHGKDGKCPWKL